MNQPSDEEIIRRALNEEASRIVPDPGALESIRERTATRPWWQRRRVMVLATAIPVAAATIAVGVVLSNYTGPGADGETAGTAAEVPADATTQDDGAGDEAAAGEAAPEDDQGTGGDDAVVNAPSGQDPAEVPHEEPRTDSAQFVTVPAYYIADTPAGPRLAREFRLVRAGGDAAETALGVMAAGPADPDYRTPWDSAAFTVGADGAIEVDVDLPDSAAAPAEPELAIQQLVYTATAALQRNDPVHILIDGTRADELWGVDVSGDLTRAPQLDVRALVQINDPGEGATVERPVRVSGEAALFEATYEWQVLRDGEVVGEGFGQSEEGQRFAAFSFEVELDPGDYTVIVTATDPSDGEGPGAASDSKTFTVTG